MITDAIWTFLCQCVVSLATLFPPVPVPDWLGNADGAMGTVFAYAGSMGVWFPTSLALTVVAAVGGAWAVGFAIKLARIVASFFTLGGGSAA